MFSFGKKNKVKKKDVIVSMNHKIFTYLLFIFITISVMGSCITTPDYNAVPQIEFVSFTKTSMVQGFNTDTTQLTIHFEDGDGDIGFDEEQGMESNIFLIDNRTGEIYDRFRAPSIPGEGANNGVSGEIRMVVLTACCIFPDNIPNCETPDQYPTNDLSFTVYIVDRAGNESNRINTSTITLLCE